MSYVYELQQTTHQGLLVFHLYIINYTANMQGNYTTTSH